MAQPSEFVQFLMDQMAFLEGLRSRRMFGSFGIFWNNLMIALVNDDTLYLKADSKTRDEFERAGSMPFTYTSRGRRVALGYYEAPEVVLDDPDAMRYWVELACEAALRNSQSRLTRL